jgi:hypothetical protein
MDEGYLHQRNIHGFGFLYQHYHQDETHALLLPKAGSKLPCITMSLFQLQAIAFNTFVPVGDTRKIPNKDSSDCTPGRPERLWLCQDLCPIKEFHCAGISAVT